MQVLEGRWTTVYSREMLSHCHDAHFRKVVQGYIDRYEYTRNTSKTRLDRFLWPGPSHPRGQLPPPQVRGARRPRRGDPEQRLPVGILEHGVVPGLAGADPSRDGGNVQGPMDHLARGFVGGDGVADGERARVTEQAGGWKRVRR